MGCMSKEKIEELKGIITFLQESIEEINKNREGLLVLSEFLLDALEKHQSEINKLVTKQVLGGTP
jgi:hypothetical protein